MSERMSNEVAAKIISGLREGLHDGVLMQAIRMAEAALLAQVDRAEYVQTYLWALRDEMKRRGSMFPQTSDEQSASQDAIYETINTVEFYGKTNSPDERTVAKFLSDRAANRAYSKEAHRP